jgi:hypothetical protein
MKLQVARLPDEAPATAPVPSEPQAAQVAQETRKGPLAERPADEKNSDRDITIKDAAGKMGEPALPGAGPGGGGGLVGPGFAAPQAPNVATNNNRYDGRPGTKSPFRYNPSAPPTLPAKPSAGLAGAAGGAAAPGATLNGVTMAPSTKADADGLKWLGDGGWQPGRFKQAIPDNLLPFGSDRALLQSDKLREAAAAQAKGIPPAGRRGVLFAKLDQKGAAGESKFENRDEQQYRKDLEKAKEVTQKKYQELQKRLGEELDRQRSESGEQLGKATEAETKAAAAPEFGGSNITNNARGLRNVPVPAETRAIIRVRTAVPTSHPLVVREYAAPRPGSDKRETSELEADTILWQPVIVLPNSGKTTLHVQLGSAQGGYQVLIAGHTLDGRIGGVRGFIPVAEVVNADPNKP